MLLLLEPSLLIYVTNLTAGKQSFRYALCAIVWNEVIVEPQYWNCLYWKAQNLSGQTILLHVLLLNQSWLKSAVLLWLQWLWLSLWLWLWQWLWLWLWLWLTLTDCDCDCMTVTVTVTDCGCDCDCDCMTVTVTVTLTVTATDCDRYCDCESLLRLQNKLDSTQSYYHYLLPLIMVIRLSGLQFGHKSYEWWSPFKHE